jgi:hypothetical protein
MVMELARPWTTTILFYYWLGLALTSGLPRRGFFDPTLYFALQKFQIKF